MDIPLVDLEENVQLVCMVTISLELPASSAVVNNNMSTKNNL